ncbi:MAG: hypothetical protein HQ481_15475 [Alphaproteobacteria bacterium]|nr:hypothetical protein [Alphaproteobacteria bacterium]
MTTTSNQKTAARGAGSRSALTRKIFRTAFLLYLAAALTITGSLVIEAYLSARADLQRELNIYRMTMEDALSGALWAIDLEEVKSISTGLLAIPQIAGLRVLDHNRAREFVTVGDLDTGAAGGWLRGPISVSFDVYYTHAVGRDRVGYITLLASSQVLWERLSWRIGLLLAAALLKIVILWLIFVRVSRSILVRPIIELTQAARSTALDRLERLEFDEPTAHAAEGTEIEVLRQAFNDMVTKLRDSRDALARVNADLEHRVDERTQELERRGGELSAALARADRARREAAAALDAAERADRGKSEFLALVSHELRTPLNSIMGFAEIIRDQAGQRDDPETLREYSTAIHDSGAHLLTLINDILDLSKIEAGRMEIDPEWIDPVGAARTVIELLRETADRKGVRLENQLEPSIGALHADPRRFRQMLTNLVSNAIKYTQAAGEVVVTADTAKDGGLTFSITDTGVGMSKPEIAHALEAFSRVSNPMTRSQQGTGLGLPLVARMAQLHGGRLTLDSQPGEGTIASLWFPASRRQKIQESQSPKANTRLGISRKNN